MNKLIILFLAVILTGCGSEDPQTAKMRDALELFYINNGPYKPVRCYPFIYGQQTFFKCNAGDRRKPWGALYQLVRGPGGLSVATVNGTARSHLDSTRSLHRLEYDNGQPVPRTELPNPRDDIDKIYEASIQ